MSAESLSVAVAPAPTERGFGTTSATGGRSVTTTITPLPVVCLVAFLLGVGQHMPNGSLYLYGIGPGDLLLLVVCITGAALGIERWPVMRLAGQNRAFVALLVAFVFLGLLSGTVNSTRDGMLARDLVETLRPLYYLLLVFTTAAWVERYGIGPVLSAYLAGVIYVAYANYSFEREGVVTVFGFRTMYAPNVVGYLLGFSTVIASLLVLERRYGLAATLISGLTVFSLFTFSKGTWLMVAMGLSLFVIVFFDARGRHPRERPLEALLVYALILLGIAGAVVAAPAIGGLIGFKMDVTGFGLSAAEGGSFSQRWGYVVASVFMAMEHPLVGIGISNYQAAYDRLREVMADNFWVTDNPHSALLYVLACMGIPAFAVYVTLLAMPFVSMARALPQGLFVKWFQIAMCLGATLIYASGALHVLSQPPWWFFVGVVFGYQARSLQPASSIG